jgi:LuxR family maltose regulon positive regulatory protein
MNALAFRPDTARRAPPPARARPLQNVRVLQRPTRPVLSFARTKIQPPRSRALLDRPTLRDRLVRALTTQPLVLVTAAAGFGKTSALAQALAALPAGTAQAWVSCDAGDHPLQLFACLVAALEPFDLPWRVAPDALIAAAAAADDTPAARLKAERAIAAELINALDACEVPHGVIAVDDLHRIDHPGVFEFLDLLLERFTPRWTLAIASREPPPIALARLRAQGDVTEFALDALRFDERETLALALAAGIDADAAEALHARTAGWPAGLRLALNVLRSMPGSSLEGSAPLIDRQVFDFLATEVLDRLPAELREFLLSTSVLPELSAARCAALTGDARAAEQLDAIERAGLFVSVLGDTEPTPLPTLPVLRLHDLFRDALEHRLRRERPDQWLELLRRAAASEPDGLRRVGGFLRAEAWAEAEAALCELGEPMILQGDAPAVGSLIERFPPDCRSRSPGLLFLNAKLAWSRWDWSAMLELSTASAAAYARDGDAAGQARALSYRAMALAGSARIDAAREAVAALLARPDLDDAVAARVLMAQAWIEFANGDQRAIAPLWARLMDHLERTPQLVSWYECMPIPSFASLPGMRAPLTRYVQIAKTRWPDRPSPPRGMCTVIEGLLHLWAGDFARAEACAAQAADDARWLARPVNLDSYATLLPALLHAVQGRNAPAQALVQGQLDFVTASGDPVRIGLYRGIYLYAAMRCAAAADDHAVLAERAAQLLTDVQADGAQSALARQYLASASAYAALAAGNDSAAAGHWEDIVAREHESDLYAQVPEARLRLAEIRLRADRDARAAADILAPLFARIEAGGEWGLVRMAGTTVLQRLASAAWQTHLTAQRQQGLRRWAGAAGQGSDAGTRADAATHNLPAGLSEREREVLERIAAGDSNKLIARAFDLSPHTVKRHVANILDKLDLRSRGQAAAWFRERSTT